ncbi:MAG: pyruvate kinase [Campylobacterales bacterium]|nr:pyruvate kinase [Campylobacterales bacterium]
MKKCTKILATVGPSCQDVGTLEEMIRAGVNLFRLNFSHGSHEYHTQMIENIRQASQNVGLIVGILQDISGPKIRIGKLEESFELRKGDLLEFVKEEIVGHKVRDAHYKLCINQSEVLKNIRVDEYIYLYDGIIRVKVVDVDSSSVKGVVQNSGMLSSQKGVNFPNTRIGINVITKKDKDDIRWGVENGVDFMAISFVQNADDIVNARDVVDSFGGDVQLIAKIEKFDAVENIDEIISVSDGLMVARGDLGIEVPYYKVPSIQKMLIKKANEASIPVITATQMLLSMTKNDVATRAEISDVANAVLDGSDVVMLSEESAIGHNPVLVVETMCNTIREIEESSFIYDKFDTFKANGKGDIIDESCVRLASNLDVDAILTFTTSGKSAKKIARFRPKSPIYAITHSDKVARWLTMSWGVVPAFMIPAKDEINNILSHVIKDGVKRKTIKLDGVYVLTAGNPLGIEGNTNSIRILRSYELEYFYNLLKIK